MIRPDRFHDVKVEILYFHIMQRQYNFRVIIIIQYHRWYSATVRKKPARTIRRCAAQLLPRICSSWPVDSMMIRIVKPLGDDVEEEMLSWYIYYLMRHPYKVYDLQWDFCYADRLQAQTWVVLHSLPQVLTSLIFFYLNCIVVEFKSPPPRPKIMIVNKHWWFFCVFFN